MRIGIRARSWTGLALARARADLALIAVSALVVVVAATVMVATAVHPAASASRSAVRALEAADTGASSIVVTTDIRLADAATVDGKVRGILADALGPMAGTIVRSQRSESWGVPGATDSSTPISLFASIEGLRDRVHLVAGAWPTRPANAVPGGDIPVALTQAAADRMGLGVGGRKPLASRLDPKRGITIIVTGILELTDRTDPAWAGDPLVLDGSTSVGPFTTAGPMFVDEADLPALVISRTATSWVAIPTFAGLPAAALTPLAGSTRAIPTRLATSLGTPPAIAVTTQLPALLADASAALDRAGSGSTAIAGPLVAIALYALVLVAALVVDRRRVSTTLLRARGAGAGALLRLALVEAALLGVLASAVGVPLGILVVLAIGGSEGWGSGLLPPTVSGWSVGAVAALTALAATVALLLPTLGSAGPLARLRRLARRRPGSMAATRSGLDLALLALAGLLLWQLRSGGASATATGRGLGPLDMAAPALSLLAGSVLSLRLTGFLARIAGALGGRTRAALPAIAGRSVARRADAHARVALLIVAAGATALLCASLGRSWTIAQRDQAAHAVAADVSGEVHTVVGASRAGALAAYLAVPGVTRATGLISATFDAGAALRRGRLIAIPADPAVAAGALREDLGDRPIGALLASLVAARPDLPRISLPDGTTQVRATIGAQLHHPGSPAQGGASAASLGVALILMAPDGTLTRTDAVQLGTDGTAEITLPGASAAVIGVEVEVTSSGGSGASGTVRVAALEAASASGPWASVALRPAIDGWSFTRTAFGISASPLGSAPSAPDTVLVPDNAPVTGPGATVVAFRPTALATLAAQPIAALADPTFLAAAQPGLDATRTVNFSLSDTRRFGVTGSISSFPGVDVPGLLVADLGTWQLVGYGTSGTVPSPTAWWLATDGADDARVAKAVGSGTYPLANVRSLASDVAGRLNNPIADAVLGSLGAVGSGAVLIAVLGVVAASAQGARARRGEIAVVRAQGLAAPSLTGWLLAEEAFPIAAGLIGGVLLGAAVTALVVPALVHALDGAPAVPPVTVVMPIDLAAGLAIGALGLAVILAVGRLRSTLAVRLAVTLRSDAPGAEA